ncbi:SDR family NAD(P)-dependent oxidoreductase [Nocardia sp. CA-136227]|uniref:SDR family NAD(P)-dependent oxidoreductase n=1 Tax=Nocardia sp. CA-136227 TaxID=3239979 RepID=UPI003D98AEC3
MQPDLTGKVVVITGASRGLGRAMALGFARAGADVVVSSRTAEACEEVAAEIRAVGRRAVVAPCHVGRWSECAHLIDRARATFGRIDVLVNNAGIAPVAPALQAIGEELFDKTLAVNLKGPLRLTALAADLMPDGASVINISSRASTKPTPPTVVYAAAKAGLNALTIAAAQEFGPRGIRVNAIVCGPFRTSSFTKALDGTVDEHALTDRIPLRRIGDPEEIIGTALWLGSAASSYVTGALITLDGGA